MAKGIVTHSCGHESVVTEHSRREVDRRIARLRNEPCWDCVNRERAARLTAMAEADGLPPLTGSEKQVVWAVKLRAHALACYDKEALYVSEALARRFPALDTATIADVLLLLRQDLRDNTSARVWIDYFRTSLEAGNILAEIIARDLIPEITEHVREMHSYDLRHRMLPEQG